jgi:hypothetical protein
MLSDLIPSISRHYRYSALNHDYDGDVEIINAIARLPPGDVGEFLASLAGSLDGLFYRLEVDLEGYDEIKDMAIQALKTPFEEDMEEFD